MSNYGQGDLFERMETMKEQMAEQARDNEFKEQVRISQQQAREQAALTRGNPIMDAIVTSGYLLKVLVAGPVLAVTSPMWAPFKAGRHAARQLMEVCKNSKNGYFYRPTGSVFSTNYGKTNFTICSCGCGLIIGDGSLVSNE
jgi:hypothetical protein